MKLQIRSQSECRYDEVSLGEVMLRLDPGDTRVRCARSFRAIKQKTEPTRLGIMEF